MTQPRTRTLSAPFRGLAYQESDFLVLILSLHHDRNAVQASYVKAIDVWMGACMAFVFSAMIEFTVVNYCTRRKQRKTTAPTKSLSEQVQSLVAQYKDKRASTDSAIYQEYQNGTAPYEVSLFGSGTDNSQSLHKKQIRELNQPTVLMRRNFLPSMKRKAIEERIRRSGRNRKYERRLIGCGRYRDLLPMA
ncbi:hypothetical protein COOONC_02244 [Cooperia oncophora]